MGNQDLAAQLATELAPLARGRLNDLDASAYATRLQQVLPDTVRTLAALYGTRTDTAELVRTLVGDALDHAAARPEPLRALDRIRHADPGWFQQPDLIGYVCYADRFAGTLAGVRQHLDYLVELGVSYLHLMPVLKPRPGDNDGGYAVADYDAIDPRLGSMADLTALAADLHQRDLVLCIDMVLNHTAREHAWARKAAAGDPFYRDFYLIYPDRSQPDAFEQTLPDIFPELAPGNFTFDAELQGWVWTTFYDFQWDLDYANPQVFRAMLNTMLGLANRGADVLRLDAAPFLWKRLGTDCQNQPEAHLILQAFRALTRLVAPGLLLKAEAMVAPELLGGYLGNHEVYRPECDLAYDNQLMVMLWSAMATGDARLATRALGRRPPAPDPTSWVSYLRCHDDIGWAVSDVDAEAVGLDGPSHRRMLSDFYAGRIAGSFARGEVFQHNPSGASPISGTLASLCGVQAALAGADAGDLELALRRLETMYSVAFSFGGIPLIYMGDELALLNDTEFADEPGHSADNRWLHRPRLDWSIAQQRGDQASVPGRAHATLRALVQARRGLASLRSNAATTLIDGPDRQLLSYLRCAPGQRPVLAVVNVGSSPRPLKPVIRAAGLAQPVPVHTNLGSAAGSWELPACGFCWLIDAGSPS